MAANKLVAGNWKMHGTSENLGDIMAIARGAQGFPNVDVALCLPATLIDRAARAVPGFAVGGQDVHRNEKGAHTGSISIPMLRDAGASLSIVGHSERRQDQHESNADVRSKAESGLAGGLDIILCVGESLDVRQAGEAIATVCAQLRASLPQSLNDGSASLAVAYEPIWAIGTGLIPTMDDIGSMHAELRACLSAAYGDVGATMRILYGGSVKGSNAGDIFSVANVDGALVGGASLTPADFLPIVEAAAAVAG